MFYLPTPAEAFRGRDAFASTLYRSGHPTRRQSGQMSCPDTFARLPRTAVRWATARGHAALVRLLRPATPGRRAFPQVGPTHRASTGWLFVPRPGVAAR